MTYVTQEVQDVSHSIETMVENTKQVEDAIDIVRIAAEEGASASIQNSAAIQEQLATMEEISSLSQSLSKLAEEMQSMSTKFKIS